MNRTSVDEDRRITTVALSLFPITACLIGPATARFRSHRIQEEAFRQMISLRRLTRVNLWDTLRLIAPFTPSPTASPRPPLLPGAVGEQLLSQVTYWV